MYGIDGTFAFFENLTFTTYGQDPNRRPHGDDSSYRAQMDYGGDRYGVQIERLVVGKNFNPEVGLPAAQRHVQELRPVALQPAAAANGSVRKFSGTGPMTYIENGAGRW